MGQVVTGLEHCVTSLPTELRGLNIGLLTNPSGIDATLRQSIDLIARLDDVNLAALFGPEHGIRGEAQAGTHIEAEVDRATGLPVHSLYGETRMPSQAMLSGIDGLVIDLQDVGVRYATYLSTVDNVLTVCSQNNVRVIILDRPNPLGGAIVAGGLLRKRYRSFVGTHTIPVLHGLTVGEFARLLAADRGLTEPLVVPMQGWRRSMFWDETGLPWVFPSPNLPTLDSHLIYAATCLLEGTNLSEGRGTTRPFEIIGAPWLDPDDLASALRGLELPGFRFRPLFFTPMISKHAGTRCGGVQISIHNRDTANAVELGIHLLQVIIDLDPNQFAWLEPPKSGSHYFVDLLTGGDKVRKVLDNAQDPSSLFRRWRKESDAFMRRRQPFLLYDSGDNE